MQNSGPCCLAFDFQKPSRAKTTSAFSLTISDNSEVVPVFQKALKSLTPSEISQQRPPKPDTQRYSWLAAFTQEFHCKSGTIQIAWIQAHVGFTGNELADTFAEWIYY